MVIVHIPRKITLKFKRTIAYRPGDLRFLNIKSVTFVSTPILIYLIMLQFMKNKILIPLLIVGGLAAFFSFKYVNGEDTADQRRELVMQTVMKTIKEGHFAPRAVDDSFSARVFHKLMDNFDYEKKFFTQKDMSELNKYEFSIDDEINNGSLEFFNKLDAMFTKNIDRAEGYYQEILKKPFKFNADEQIQLNGKKLQYAADENALKQRWAQYLKFRVLSKYVDLKDAQDKARDTMKTKLKTDAELEADARESVRKNQERVFKRLKKLDNNERFTMFINSITGSEDPHTDYLPPREKENFDVAMSGSFFGIGAQLRPEDGKIKIVGIVTGSPSWKQGELKNGDEIIKVGQGSQEPVDVQGYEIDDAIQLIRGKKGTEVRITVKKVDGSIKTVALIRDKVALEETFAKSAVINSDGGRIGYIYLPEFYSDFQHINGRRCAEDVAVEVQKLKSAGVNGIILDLRNNGGGSLSDVVDMAGLFIDQGPVVQVKSSDAAPMKLRDDDKGMLYDGPMVVMVNQGSASASEIMAAAMQDYKRAVIVGAPTYGKGTVQKLVSLDDFIDPLTRMRMQSKGEGAIGALKITVQKFYRVNGGSTQLKGVTPDIQLPDPYAMIDIGERRDKAALKWDEIPAADYKPVSNPANVPVLAAMSKQRVAANPVFTLITAGAEKLKKQEEDNTYSLNEAAYRKELAEANETSRKLEELEKKDTQLNITNLKEDVAKMNQDSMLINRNNDWIKALKKDIYLSETVNIINDMAKQTMKVNMGTGMK